jgi:hypothetical protein
MTQVRTPEQRMLDTLFERLANVALHHDRKGDDAMVTATLEVLWAVYLKRFATKQKGKP